MSFQVMAWPGDKFRCRVCGADSSFNDADYERLCVCSLCVRTLAKQYLLKHGGYLLPEFCSPSEWASYSSENAKPKSRPDLNRSDWKDIRLQIAARDGLVCHYCKAAVKPKSFTVDHLIPFAKGGTENLSNLVACCRSCNSKKGAKDYGDFTAMERT